MFAARASVMEFAGLAAGFLNTGFLFITNSLFNGAHHADNTIQFDHHFKELADSR
jgi:hypothetical protein